MARQSLGDRGMRRQPVLELGSVSLPVVTARIDRFMTEGGKGLTQIWSEQVSGLESARAPPVASVAYQGPRGGVG